MPQFFLKLSCKPTGCDFVKKYSGTGAVTFAKFLRTPF